MIPFPFKGGLQKWLSENSYGGDINKYVQEMITQSMAHSTEHHHVTDAMEIFDQEKRKPEHTDSSLNISTFETHDHVYVRVHIKDESQLATIKVFHTSNQLIIEGLPFLEEKHVVTLPSIVKMKGAISEYRDDYLQIKMVKKIDLQFTEIDVRN